MNFYKVSNLDIKMIYISNQGSKDNSWRTKLFEDTKFFANGRVKKYKKFSDNKDFLQEAYLGLWTAIMTFDYHKNFDFYRWAQWNISKKIRDFSTREESFSRLKSNTNDVMINDAYFENTNSKIFLSEVFEQNKFCLSEKELMILNKSILKEQTLSQIGSDFGISAERVRQIKKGSLNQIKESIKFRSIA